MKTKNYDGFLIVIQARQGAGKTTLAAKVLKALHAGGVKAAVYTTNKPFADEQLEDFEGETFREPFERPRGES